MFPLDPGQLIVALTRHMLSDGHSAFAGLVDTYVLGTADFVGRGPLVSDPSIVQLYGVTSKISGALVAAALLYSSLRSMAERSFRARYTLKAILPRALVVVLLVQFGLPLIGGAMALDIAVAHAAWSGAAVPPGGCQPAEVPAPELHHPPTDRVWCALTANMSTGNIVLGFLFLLVVILLIVLALVGVVRNVVLAVLTITAPIAFLCLLLPDTHTYVLTWRRIFFATVFCQALQVLVLRLALVLSFGDPAVGALHGIVAMYLVLKVPSALHAASTSESKLITYAKHLEHGFHSAVTHAGSPHHAPAHSAT